MDRCCRTVLDRSWRNHAENAERSRSAISRQIDSVNRISASRRCRRARALNIDLQPQELSPRFVETTELRFHRLCRRVQHIGGSFGIAKSGGSFEWFADID